MWCRQYRDYWIYFHFHFHNCNYSAVFGSATFVGSVWAERDFFDFYYIFIVLVCDSNSETVLDADPPGPTLLSIQ